MRSSLRWMVGGSPRRVSRPRSAFMDFTRRQRCATSRASSSATRLPNVAQPAGSVVAEQEDERLLSGMPGVPMTSSTTSLALRYAH